jgi:hypothetical protein
VKGIRFYPYVLSSNQIQRIYRNERIDFVSWYLAIWLSLKEVWLVMRGRG